MTELLDIRDTQFENCFAALSPYLALAKSSVW